MVCSDSASAGFTGPCGSRSNARRSPTVENTRFFCARTPPRCRAARSRRAPRRVVRRLAHAHEDDGADRAQPARERDLRDDLAAPSWRSRPSRPVRAERAADRAADLGGHAQAAARQQHRLDGRAAGERHQQALAAVGRGVARRDACQAVEACRRSPAARRAAAWAGSSGRAIGGVQRLRAATASAATRRGAGGAGVRQHVAQVGERRPRRHRVAGHRRTGPRGRHGGGAHQVFDARPLLPGPRRRGGAARSVSTITRRVSTGSITSSIS